MRAVIMFVALVLPIGLVMPLGTSDGAQPKTGARTFVPASGGAGGNVGMPIYPPPGATR